MGWEVVEALPGAGAGAGGAFRDGAEPVVAQRIGMSLGERLRLYWHSTPALPIGRAAQWIVVTPHHVYVQRVDRTRARVRLDQLHGERLERGLLVYGVREDEDLLLPYRARCEVQDRLAAALRDDASVEPLHRTRGVIASLIFTLLFLGLGVGLLLTYPVDDTIDRILRGAYTSESALGTYAGFGALLPALFIFFWAPSRLRVDAVGVTRTRGVLPLFPFTAPPERFRRAVLRPSYFKPKQQRRYHAGWSVDLQLKAGARLGTLGRTMNLEVGWFSFGQSINPESRRKSEEQAHALAERLRTMLSLEETKVLPIRP